MHSGRISALTRREWITPQSTNMETERTREVKEVAQDHQVSGVQSWSDLWGLFLMCHSPNPPAQTSLSPFIFFVTLHLYTIACFHLIFLPSYGCSLSLCLWVEIESKLRPHRTSISIFQGVMELVLPEGWTFRNFWHRPARAFSYLSEKPSKVSWGAVGQTLEITFTHSCLRSLKFDFTRRGKR